MILATKVVGRGGNTWFRDDGGPTRVNRKQINEAVDKSLKRLQTDYIDLYQLHFPERPVPWGSNPTRFNKAAYEPPADETPIAEQLDAFGEIVKAGKIRHLGLSNESAWGTMSFLQRFEGRGGAARPVDPERLQPAQPHLRDGAGRDRACASMSGCWPIRRWRQGFLTGKYLDGARPAGARTTLFDRGQRYQTPGAEEAIRRYVALAKEAGARSGADGARLRDLAALRDLEHHRRDHDGATEDRHRVRRRSPSRPELETKIDAIHQLVGNPCP